MIGVTGELIDYGGTTELPFVRSCLTTDDAAPGRDFLTDTGSEQELHCNIDAGDAALPPAAPASAVDSSAG